MAEWKNSEVMTVSGKVGVKSNGTIALSGETAVGSKQTSLPNIKKNATLAQAESVLNATWGSIGGMSYAESSLVKTIKEGVA